MNDLQKLESKLDTLLNEVSLIRSDIKTLRSNCNVITENQSLIGEQIGLDVIWPNKYSIEDLPGDEI